MTFVVTKNTSLFLIRRTFKFASTLFRNFKTGFVQRLNFEKTLCSPYAQTRALDCFVAKGKMRVKKTDIFTEKWL